MSPFRFRDDNSSTATTIATVLVGAVAGFAVGMYVAQRVGGFGGLAARIKRRANGQSGDQTGRYERVAEGFDEDDVLEDEGAQSRFAADDVDADFNGMDDTGEDDLGVPTLEERVLEAFNNDPILAERAIDIGSVGRGVIELAGWVDDDDEAEHAVTVARGVPGVDTVVNRLLISEEEQQIVDTVRKYKEGDAALNEARWEGQQVGTGRRRQGTSVETDRHADPKPVLEDRWLSEREAIRNAADDVEGVSGTRGRKTRRGDEGEQPEA